MELNQASQQGSSFGWQISPTRSTVPCNFLNGQQKLEVSYSVVSTIYEEQQHVTIEQSREQQVIYMTEKKNGKNVTYHDLSHKEICLFFFDSKISGYGEVKLRVIIIDISHHYVHCGSGCLMKKRSTIKTKVNHCFFELSFFPPPKYMHCWKRTNTFMCEDFGKMRSSISQTVILKASASNKINR